MTCDQQGKCELEFAEPVELKTESGQAMVQALACDKKGECMLEFDDDTVDQEPVEVKT